MTDQGKKRDFHRAIKAYRRSDESRWVFNLFASRIVGVYGRGGTIGLAADMNVSTDTVEDGAHAYRMYKTLMNMGDVAEKRYVRDARKLPYIYVSHFRKLYDLQLQRNLTNEQIMNLLIDIVQAEGGISSRNLEDHVNSRYGDTRDWTWYAMQTQKKLVQLLGQPDLPQSTRKKAEDLFSELGDNS